MANRIARPVLAANVAGLVGSSLTVRDIGTGWPSRVTLQTEAGNKRIALHVSQVSPHSREDWEWRFQNPATATPVSAPGASLPLLVGLAEVAGRPVLVVVNGKSRIDRATRFSILFNKRICLEAAATGWSEQTSSSGERIFAMWPRLLPVAVELIVAGVEVDSQAITAAADASGLLEDDSDLAGERTRRTVSSFVRDSKFSGAVKEAYSYRCAMCEVGLGLVVGAHILPVSAPAAPDKVWNGISLCHNHHSAFDAYKIWIGGDYSLTLNPTLQAEAVGSASSTRFLKHTRDTLLLPIASGQRPRLEMLEQRYAYYEDRYEWAPKL